MIGKITPIYDIINFPVIIFLIAIRILICIHPYFIADQ